MKIPSEVLVELRAMVEEIRNCKSFSVTIHSDGVRKWSTELKITSQIVLATASYDTTTGQHQFNGQLVNGR